MDPVRIFRVLLGAAIFLLATFLFEPSLFGGRLPADLMAAEMFRNVVGVVGAVCGILVMFDAIFPKPAARPAPSYRAFEPEPPAPAAEPKAAFSPMAEPEAKSEAQPDEAAAEAPWGSYVAPDEHTLGAARSLVEAELAEGATKPVIEGGLPHPPPRDDTH